MFQKSLSFAIFIHFIVCEIKSDILTKFAVYTHQ